MNKADVLSMRRVKFTVIDEADEMLSGDWDDEMAKIMGGSGKSTVPCRRFLNHRILTIS